MLNNVNNNNDLDALCDSFERKLNNFKHEVDSLLGYVYTEQTIRTMGGSSKTVLNALNKDATFWNTILGSLQNSIFITLGRIFDMDHEDETLNTLFRYAESNKVLFSKDTFSHRWLNKNHEKHMRDYLSTYIQGVFEPTDEDFRKVKRHILGLRREYDSYYKDPRHYFAHKKIRNISEINQIFEKIKIHKLEKFVVALSSLHIMFWQMYHNGRKMNVPSRRVRSSTRGFLIRRGQVKYPPMITEQVVRNTEQAVRKFIH